VIGVGSEQVGPLTVVVGHGDDGFAALLEVVDGARHFLQLGEAGPLQALGLDHQCLDAIVIPGAPDGPQQIGQDDLAGLIVALVDLFEQLHRGVGLGALFHQHASEIEGEGTLDGRTGGLVLVDADDDDQHDEQKQQVDQHQSGKVEQAPEAAKEPPQTFENRHSRVVALLMGRERHY